MDRRGFTFLELMVVLMLMAIMTAIAAPALGRMYQSLAVDSAARRVMSVFQQAKDAALTSRDKVQVQIEPASNKFSLISKDEQEVTATIQDTSIESVNVGGSFQSLSGVISVDIFPLMVKKKVVVRLKGPDGKVNDVILNVGGGHIAVR